MPLSVVGSARGMTIYMRGNDNACQLRFKETGDEIRLMYCVFMDAFIAYNTNRSSVSGNWHEGQDRLSDVSKREADCLHWVARGKINGEIGEALKISENTVRYHLKNAYRKLGANTRSRAVNRALQAGIIKF